ncbi:MAG: CotH kinase family protein, partial [Clostridia bacterium]
MNHFRKHKILRMVFFSIALTALVIIMSIFSSSSKTYAATELDFSYHGGFYATSIQLELSSIVPGAQIYYTLNNTLPSVAKLGSGTFLYQGPITIVDRTPELSLYAPIKLFGNGTPITSDVKIPKCTVVKAVAISPTYQTATITNTYFIDPLKEKKFNLPVFSLSSDPVNFYDATQGLFVNEGLQNSTVLTDYEKPLHLEYFDESGTQILNQGTGVRLHGMSTMYLPQKTLRLYAKTEYDPINTKFRYEFFPWTKNSDGEAMDSFKRLLLRNSGNDFGSTMIRDAFNQILGRKLNIDIMEYRPAVAYFDGEFYGIVNIRERLDNEYVADHYPVNKDDVVVIQAPGPNGGELDEGVSGDQTHYVNLHKYIDNNDLNVPANLAYVDSQIDLSCLQDYFALENYVKNYDWPVKNVRIWRSKQAVPVPGVKGADGRWRYMVCDTDISTDMWRAPEVAAADDA